MKTSNRKPRKTRTPFQSIYYSRVSAKNYAWAEKKRGRFTRCEFLDRMIECAKNGEPFSMPRKRKAKKKLETITVKETELETSTNV